ncbi:hypothetical protein [Jannaschia helgolandensis]|uniref:Archaellum biogenesis protein FlaH, an ATPase n=1 Tax=Jannaschia helgolandensis TaxID=188906 RepID=A0A1H7QEP5_9RHOB|nr:hypothetical protein [Jannaschia helgolandensis]SEL46114.1 Archaellum biogenesis protein FlaH, an ATPase [Jannaschia helgolandensis]
MSGPKTNHDESVLPPRIDARNRAFGHEVKEMMKELGFATQLELLQALPETVEYTPDTFRFLLAGRREGPWFDAFQAIIAVFAERQMAMFPSAHHEGREKTEQKIRARVFGDQQLEPQPSDDIAAPSFRPLALPTAPSEYADDFLDVKAPTLDDIAAGFDIDRYEYVKEGGIRSAALACLGGDPANYIFTISGPSGSGKSVISQRLALDCLRAGYGVHSLYADWTSPKALSHQIRDVVSRDCKPSLFLIDGAARLARGQVSLSDVSGSLDDIKFPVVLVATEVWRILSPNELASLNRDKIRAYHWSVGRLSDNELNALIDKVVSLETEGKVRHIRCHLSKAARIALCQEERDRLLAATLLIFRYGRAVSDLLVEEFNSLSGSFAQIIYEIVITFSGLKLDVPVSVINRILRKKKIQESGFWNTLERVTANREGCVGIRHELFFRYIAPFAVPSSHDRARNLLFILLHLSEESPTEDDFARSVFAKTKPIANLLVRDESAVGSLIQEGREAATGELPEVWCSDWLTCLGRLARIVLFDHDTAEVCFSRAVAANPQNKFAHRERSWNLLHAGRIGPAEDAAREAVRAFPSDVQTLVQSATVLQYTSEAGFDFAGELFETALQIDVNNDEARDKLDRYEDAKAYRTYITKNWSDLEEDILERLRAPWFIWTVRKGVGTSRWNKALRGKLGGLIRDPMGDIDEIREVAEVAKYTKDKFTKALLLANVARAEYLQWYHGGMELDADRVEKQFETALSNAPREPFIRTWFGTFLKEVREDWIGAEREYRSAIKMACEYTSRDGQKPFEDHPMLLNNLAILLKELGRKENDPRAKYKEADDLLKRAIAKIDGENSRFQWPKEEFEDLQRLKAEAGLM